MMNTRSARWIYQATTALGLVLAVAGCSTHDPLAPVTVAEETEHATMLMRYCNKLRAAGDLYVAASICQRAYETNPMDPAPLYVLADINLELGATEQAANSYRAAIVINPDDFEALYGLAKITIDQGNYDMAEAQLERALQLNGEDARVYNALGIVKDQKQQHDVAQGLYRTGLLIDPGNVSLRNNLGLSLALSGRQGESVEMLRNVAGQPGTGTITSQNLALAANIVVPMPVSEDGDGPIEIRMEPDAEMVEGEMMEEGDQMAAALAKPLHKTAGRPAEALDGSSSDGMAAAMDGEPAGTPMSLMAEGQSTDHDADHADGQDDGHLGNASASLDPQMAEASPMGELSTSMPAEFMAGNDHAMAEESPQMAASDATAMPKPVMSPDGKYMVQVGAYGSHAGAEKGWKVLNKKAEDLLGALNHNIQEADAGKGTVYRLRAGPLANRSGGNQLCAALSDRGLGCFVVTLPQGESAAKSMPKDDSIEPMAIPLKPAAEAGETSDSEASIQG